MPNQHPVEKEDVVKIFVMSTSAYRSLLALAWIRCKNGRTHRYEVFGLGAVCRQHERFADGRCYSLGNNLLTGCLVSNRKSVMS